MVVAPSLAMPLEASLVPLTVAGAAQAGVSPRCGPDPFCFPFNRDGMNSVTSTNGAHRNSARLQSSIRTLTFQAALAHAQH